MSTVLALVPLFPLLGVVLCYLAGRANKDLSAWIATAASTASFAAVLVLFFNLQAEPGAVIESSLFTWIAIDQLSVGFDLRFDHLSAVMSLVVTGIGSLIHLYSVGYMAEDESRPRFFAYLNLFMFSMLLLVLGANLLVLFVGWEGVGLCSYLLIGFWHRKIAFADAGMKAFVVNRIGDAAFLIALFLLVSHFGTLDFSALADQIGSAPEGVLSLIALCLFIGATGKSAQIPLFVWLPDAMAGPTPVSALIHAATMVTAGVYLVARMAFLFEAVPEVMVVVVVIALLTSLVAALIALVQNDIKKVLAYSTVSQLGFMFMAAGAGAYWVAIFHVVTHAFFKACLFLGSGSVIHACHHEQDMREMGGLLKKMPWTGATYLISTIAIAGIYPFAGYFSKHHIKTALAYSGEQNPLLEGLAANFGLAATVIAVLTAFYMTRSFVMTFLGEYRGHAHPHESPAVMVIPLVVLAALSLVGGYFLEWHHTLHDYLALTVEAGHGHAGKKEGLLDALFYSWPGFLGVGLALLLYTTLSKVPGAIASGLKPITFVLAGKFFVDELYHAVIVAPLRGFSRFLWRGADQLIIDGTVNGTAAVVDVTGEVVRNLNTGQLRHYGLFMFAGALFLLVFYFLL